MTPSSRPKWLPALAVALGLIMSAIAIPQQATAEPIGSGGKSTAPALTTLTDSTGPQQLARASGSTTTQASADLQTLTADQLITLATSATPQLALGMPTLTSSPQQDGRLVCTVGLTIDAGYMLTTAPRLVGWLTRDTTKYGLATTPLVIGPATCKSGATTPLTFTTTYTKETLPTGCTLHVALITTDRSGALKTIQVETSLDKPGLTKATTSDQLSSHVAYLAPTGISTRLTSGLSHSTVSAREIASVTTSDPAHSPTLVGAFGTDGK